MTDATFYNVWRTKTPKDRAALIAKMKDEAPALAAKTGFVSMSVLECAEDGRVLVEARWQSKEAFDRAVTDDPEAHRSRASLAELGLPEPGLFTEAFRISPAHASAMVGGSRAVISAASGIVTYVQVWRMSATGNQRRWLETMHSHIGLLTRQPGFLSMSLHASLDGKQTAVYAQWENETSLTAAISSPDAKRSHDEMARWGTPDGSLYGVDSVFLPYGIEQAQRVFSPQKNTANSQTDIEEHRAEVNGQAIHYLKAGAGPALLLVHGYPESSESWRKVMPELAKSFTVIAPDTRGVGQSSVADNFSLEDVADDVYELVKSLGFKDVCLVGQDFGVQVVSAYAAKHREEVSALVAIESPLSAFGLEDLFGSFWHFGFLASPLAEMLIAGKEKEFFHAFAIDTFVFRKEAFSPADIDRYIANQTRSGRLKAGLTYYRALLAGKAFFANTVAPPWTFPVLAIDGDHSMNGLTAKSFARIAPGLKSHTAPDCGHFVQEEQPEFLVKTLLDFLPRW
jgi:pimeloyl-ACP methyl ester carboxylesterase/heme-degrading monooxygenase HmoA